MTSSENVMELGNPIMKMESSGVMENIKMEFKKEKTRYITRMEKSVMEESGKMTNKSANGFFTTKKAT